MQNLRYLNKYFIKYKYRLLIGILITILSKFLAIQIPSFVKNSLNIVEEYNRGNVTNIEIVKSTLLNNILLIIGAALLSGFFTFLMRQTLVVMSRLIEFDLKNEVFKHYQSLSQRFFKQNRTGDLMNRISEDVGKVRMYVGPAIMYTMNMLVLFTIALIKMFSIDVTLSLYAVLPLPLLSVSIYFLSKIIQKRSTIVQEYLSKLTTYVQEVISGISVIKVYANEEDARAKFSELAIESKNKNVDLFKAQALFFPLMILLIGLSNILVIYIGGLRYINGQIDNIGTIAEFIIYVNMLTWPVAVIGWVTSIVQQAEVSQKRLNEFLKEKSEILDQGEPKEIDGKIEFKNVDFTYSDTNITALSDVSFTIEKGKTLGIIGKTGSGKSTLIYLLTKLYNTQKGCIKIDGVKIDAIDLQSLRTQIGIVPQDGFLFSDTIFNNIKFGNENSSEEEVFAVAKLANIHENIIKFKDGYYTLVGERGVTLSGGQKQRVSIARALLSKPKILIFDDCLSAVDTKTEEQILQNLDKVSKEISAIIISHRISSIKNADSIIVFENGKIIQNGTHKELLNQKGYYQEIYEQQLREE